MSPGNLINHASGWLESGLTNSFEKVVIDTELLRSWANSLKKIEVNRDDLAVDAIKDVPPGGHFFGTTHTLSRFETAFYRPLVSDWRNFETWKDDRGGRTPTERATDIWQKVLETYTPPPLDPGVLEELDSYMSRRCAEIGDQ